MNCRSSENFWIEWRYLLGEIENAQPPLTLSFVQTHVMGSNETYVPYRNVNSIDEVECINWQLNNKYEAHHKAHQMQVDSSDYSVIHVLFDDSDSRGCLCLHCFPGQIITFIVRWVQHYSEDFQTRHCSNWLRWVEDQWSCQLWPVAWRLSLSSDVKLKWKWICECFLSSQVGWDQALSFNGQVTEDRRHRQQRHSLQQSLYGWFHMIPALDMRNDTFCWLFPFHRIVAKAMRKITSSFVTFSGECKSNVQTLFD